MEFIVANKISIFPTLYICIPPAILNRLCCSFELLLKYSIGFMQLPCALTLPKLTCRYNNSRAPLSLPFLRKHCEVRMNLLILGVNQHERQIWPVANTTNFSKLTNEWVRFSCWLGAYIEFLILLPGTIQQQGLYADKDETPLHSLRNAVVYKSYCLFLAVLLYSNSCPFTPLNSSRYYHHSATVGPFAITWNVVVLCLSVIISFLDIVSLRTA